MNNRDYAPRGNDPSYQDSYNQGGQGNYNSQERRDSFQGDQENYMHPEQKGLRRDQRNMVPSQGGSYGQGLGSGYGQNSGQGSNHEFDQNYGPGATAGAEHGAGKGFSQAEQRNVQGEPTGSIGQRWGQQVKHSFFVKFELLNKTS